MALQNGDVNGKEGSGQAVRKRYDDEGCFLQLPSIWAEAEKQAMEAHLRLLVGGETPKQEQEQAP